MQTLPPPQDTFKATVSQAFLKKVDRVFDAAPLTIWCELLQNARRAGASEVHVEFTVTDGGTSVTFQDNGKGLDGPAPLLCLAEQDTWGEEIAATEDPAGMGFFCLTKFDSVAVTSQNWRATITRKAFMGSEVVKRIPTMAGWLDGFRIEWKWEGFGPNELVTLEQAAMHCGLLQVTWGGDAVSMPGKPLTVCKPRPYIPENAFQRYLPELDVMVGVVADRVSYYDGPNITLNFYGVTFNLKGDLRGRVADMLGIDVAVLVDVRSTRKLRLVLPARNAIVQNEHVQELTAQAEKAIYEWIMEHNKGEHKLPFEFYVRARELYGLDKFPEAAPPASLVRLAYSGRAEKMQKTVKIPRRLWTAGGFTDILSNFTASNSAAFAFFRTDERFAGYSWYDSMVEMTDLIVYADELELPWDAFEAYTPAANCKEIHTLVDELQVRFEMSDGTGAVFHPDAALVSQAWKSSHWSNYDGSEGEHIFIRREQLADPGTIAQELLEYLYAPSDDYSEREDEDCRQEFHDDVLEWVLKLTGSDMEAARYRLNSTLWDLATDASVVWQIKYDDSVDRRPRITQFCSADNAAECSKRVTYKAGHHPLAVVEDIVSNAPLTEERIITYLQRKYGEPLGQWATTPIPAAVNLDEWEVSNAKALLDEMTSD